MNLLQFSLSRRMFLKVNAHLAVFTATSRSKLGTAAIPEQQQSLPTRGYGSSNYSQGEYPGYKAYLPLVNKEGN